MSDLLPTADVLAAGALALGALTVMYSLWRPTLTHALSQERKRHREDRDPAIRVIQSTRRQTAFPLALATSILLAVLTPSAVAVVWESVQHVRQTGLDSVLDYRPALAVYLVVWVFLTALTGLTWIQFHRLTTQRNDFSAAD